MDKPAGCQRKTSRPSKTFRQIRNGLGHISLHLQKKTVLRILALPFVSAMLVTILLTAPLVPFLGKEYCTAMILGSSEEENNSHDLGESKIFDGKYFILKNFFSVDPTLNAEHHQNTLDYSFTVLEFTIEILDPPPKKLIS